VQGPWKLTDESGTAFNHHDFVKKYGVRLLEALKKFIAFCRNDAVDPGLRSCTQAEFDALTFGVL
jgi:hypothetical protein